MMLLLLYTALQGARLLAAAQPLTVGGQPTAQYCDQSSLTEYLNWSVADPPQAVVCPFVQGGSGMPPEVISLLVFGSVGLALTIRVRHPGPLLVAFMLTGGIAAAGAPGGAINLLGIAVFVGISALGIYLYQRAQSEL